IASPSVMLPGLRTRWSPDLIPSKTSTPSSARRPVLMRFSEALPSFTRNTRSMPANETTAAAGTSKARYPDATTHYAREKHTRHAGEHRCNRHVQYHRNGEQDDGASDRAGGVVVGNTAHGVADDRPDRIA